ncbi:MAG: S66 peptidase family protein, partial [Stellaceae bacterium]
MAPAGPLRGRAELDASIAHARALGWEAVPAPHVLTREGYLAGSDSQRAHDFNEAIRDDAVDGIWCVRGGYGAMRILPALDYDALRRRPKPVLGYSDITALHAAIGSRCGLVSFHAPTARGVLTEFSRDSLVRAVVEGSDSCGVAAGALGLRGGRARGRLVGGNLALLAALAGTPYAPDYDEAILVLEDVGEATYRIDRMLRQLILSGALERVAGIAFGHFTDGTDPIDVASRPLLDVLREAG